MSSEKTFLLRLPIRIKGVIEEDAEKNYRTLGNQVLMILDEHYKDKTDE